MVKRRRITALAVTLAMGVGAASAQAAVVLNEIESSPNPDFVELYNTGPATVDVGGWSLRDSAANVGADIPNGTTISAGGHYSVPSVPPLGNDGESVTLLNAADAQVDSFAWFDHAVTTFGRCPDGTGGFIATTAPTPGAANACPSPLGPWPGGAAVTEADTANGLPTGNMSGLEYVPSGSAAKGVMYAVRNNPGTLFRLIHDGTNWVQDTANGWTDGKTLLYPLGNGNPDAEGVTIDAGDPNSVYVAVERDGGGASAPRVLRYDTAGAAEPLSATDEFTLSIPGAGPNTGPEAIQWIPDVDLVAKGFRDQTLAKTYNPADYADHGTGLFFVGVEFDGSIRAYALNKATDTATLVASFSNTYGAVMDLEYDTTSKKLLAACDDTCAGNIARMDVDNTGNFVVEQNHRRPAGMPNLNNEGFAVASEAECVGGVKPAYWLDDSSTGGHALRAGTINCAASATPTVSVGPASVTEGNAGTAILQAPVTLSAASGTDVTVKYSTGGGTATAASDYTAVVDATVTIPAGQTAASAPVTVTGDVIDEGDGETFNVTLSQPTGATLGTATAAQTIADDDAAAATATPTPTATATPTPGPSAACKAARAKLKTAQRKLVTAQKRLKARRAAGRPLGKAKKAVKRARATVRRAKAARNRACV